MKRSTLVIVAAAVILLCSFATPAPAQMVFHSIDTASTAAPAQSVARATVKQDFVPINMNMGEGRVYSPESSLVQPGSAGVTAHTNVEVFVPNAFQPDQVSPAISSYGFNTPASIACVYNIQSGTQVPYCPTTSTSLTNTTGGSKWIAIVDAYDDPWIADDLSTFDSQFGVSAPPSFQVVYAAGVEPPFDTPEYDPNGGDGGWELEESLDVEYAHAIAPGANIVLVEAASDNVSDLLTAVTVASNWVVCQQATTCSTYPGTGAGEVIMSWGLGEFNGQTSYDTQFFNTPGVVYFAASGDSPGVSWPCTSPYVVCVGATTLSRYTTTTPNNGISQQPLGAEVQGTWELAGGGSSAIESLPTYQNNIASTLQNLNNGTSAAPLIGYPTGVGLSTSNRAVPDLSVNGNPNTGYWVYDSFEFALLGYIPTTAPDSGGWWIVGGTSASNNIVAGMVNLAGTAHGSFYSSSAAELANIYSVVNPTTGAITSSNFNDIIFGTGQCGPYISYTANTGWDPCSGVGVPEGLGGL